MIDVRMAMGKRKWLLIILVTLILIQSFYFLSVSSGGSANSNSDDWTMFRHDPSHSGYTNGTSDVNSAKLLWTFKTGKPVRSSPAVADSYVLVGSRDWHVYCLNASSGEQVWNYTTAGEVNSSPAVYNGSVFIGSDDGYVYSLDIATGAPIWKVAVGGLVWSSPVIANGRVYIGSGNRNFYALNASDGALIWGFTTSYSVQSSPAISEGIVYFAAGDYHLYAVNASTGDRIWRTHTGSVISSPSISNGYVYIGSIDGYVYGLNASTGAKIWSFKTENAVNSSPATADGVVFVGAEDNYVYALNGTNGQKIWQSPAGYWVWSSPVAAGGNVYVGSQDFNIYFLNASTGARKWSYQTGGIVDSSPAVANGILYVGSNDCLIYAFDLDESASENLVPQTDVPWTTIAFDITAFIVVAGVVFMVARFVNSNKLTKTKASPVNVPHRKLAWFSAHADALCLLAILAFSTVFFVNLSDGPLWAADEQTYTQWAYHMYKTGDYLTPWAYGELKMWIAKPPLIMWLMSISYQVFGVNNFASRIWSPIFGALSLIVMFYLGKKLYNRYVGLVSALVLGTFTTFFVFARHAMLDVPFIFFTLASIYFLVLHEKTENSNRYAALSGLFFGLALMTKQIQALLLPLIFFVYFLAAKKSIRFFFTKRFKRFWGVALLIFLPWVVYMILRFGPDFWDSYIIFSDVMRTFTPIEGHTGGYLYYFSYLATNENLFWIILLPFAIGLCMFNSAFKRSKADVLILAWIVIVLGVFTFAQTKLYWYILPAFPAFAIAISSLMYQLSRRIRFVMPCIYRHIKSVLSHVSPK